MSAIPVFITMSKSTRIIKLANNKVHICFKNTLCKAINVCLHQFDHRVKMETIFPYSQVLHEGILLSMFCNLLSQRTTNYRKPHPPQH